MTPLAVPLTLRQIEAANSLRDQLPGWVTVDQTLIDVAARFPEMDSSAALVKVAVLNQLYGTNVYAVFRMAEHVRSVLWDFNLSALCEPFADTALVERLADLPKTPGQKHLRKHWSFASKFAHFFVDLERFPIYDSYAERLAAYHLGTRGLIRDAERPYRAFVLNLRALVERAQLTCNWTELDRYLWFAGQYHAWKRDAKAKINTELARLFAFASSDVATELAILDPIDAALPPPEAA